MRETWVNGVIKGIDRFESRSSLKTWIFRILTNTAKTRGLREGRSVPFASLAAEAAAHPPSTRSDSSATTSPASRGTGPSRRSGGRALHGSSSARRST